MAQFFSVIFLLYIIGAIFKSGFGLIFLIVIGVIVFLIYYYSDDQVYKREREEREEKNRIKEANERKLAIEKQKKLEKVNQEESIKIANETAQKKLYAYTSSIVKNISEAKADIKPEENAELIAKINDSIDNLLLDTIPRACFLSRTVQSEKKTIFELISRNKLEQQLVLKRLNNVFALCEQAENSDELGYKNLQRKINEIFRYVMDMPANDEKDNQLLERMISSVIDEIKEDEKINEDIHYQNPFVQSDINLILEHLTAHNFSELPAVIRLKNLFSPNE